MSVTTTERELSVGYPHPREDPHGSQIWKIDGAHPTGEECEAPMRWSLGANLVVLGSVAATAIAIALFLWLLMPPPVEVQAQTTAPRQSAQYRRRHLCLFTRGAARPSSRGPLTRTTTSPSGNWRWTSTLVFSTGKRNRRRHLPPMAASPRASLTPSRMTAPTL